MGRETQRERKQPLFIQQTNTCCCYVCFEGITPSIMFCVVAHILEQKLKYFVKLVRRGGEGTKFPFKNIGLSIFYILSYLRSHLFPSLASQYLFGPVISVSALCHCTTVLLYSNDCNIWQDLWQLIKLIIKPGLPQPWTLLFINNLSSSVNTGQE